MVERLGQLVKRVDFELDLDQVPGMGPRPPQGRPDAAGQRDMVVLDQHRIVEAEAVIGAAAQPHRLLFEDAQPGGRLAGTDDFRLVTGDRVNQRAGCGGDAGEPRNQVQRGALGRQYRPRPAGDPGHRLASLDAAAVGA